VALCETSDVQFKAGAAIRYFSCWHWRPLCLPYLQPACVGLKILLGSNPLKCAEEVVGDFF